jgi:plastocyanin domain-containing protein
VPSVLRIVTRDTFDCSSSVIIPAMDIRQRLPLSGKTDIALASPAANTTLKVHCSMGMYDFTVNFTS